MCRGGGRLARNRHNLQTAGQTVEEWRAEWRAARLFVCADGDRAYRWGNGTIAWDPDHGWLEVTLPKALTELANQPKGRYRLGAAVDWPHGGDEVAAQATNGSVRYDITFDATKQALLTFPWVA